MSDMGIAQGDSLIEPFWHDPNLLCHSDCGRQDCRWLNCACEGHTDPSFINPIQFWICKSCNLTTSTIIEDAHMNGKCAIT